MEEKDLKKKTSKTTKSSTKNTPKSRKVKTIDKKDIIKDEKKETSNKKTAVKKATSNKKNDSKTTKKDVKKTSTTSKAKKESKTLIEEKNDTLNSAKFENINVNTATKEPVKKEAIKTENEKEEIKEVKIVDDKALDDIEEVRKIIKESKHEKNKDDDLYLTKSFKSLRKASFFKQFMKKVLSYIVVLGVLFAICYFFLYPYVKKNFFINPKEKINKVLDDAINGVIDLTDTYMMGNEFSVAATFDVKTNNSENKKLNDYIYTFDGNFDRLNKSYKIKYGLNEENIKLFNIVNKDSKYVSYDDESYFLSNSDENGWNDFIINKIERDNFKYYLNKHKDFISEFINKQKLNNSKDSITINGKDINVNKYSISLSKDDVNQLVGKYKKEVLSDYKIMSFYQRFNLDEDGVIELIKNYFNDALNINIYLDSKYNFKGFDIENNGFRDVYYYCDEELIDIHFNDINKQQFDIKGNVKNKVITLNIKYMNNEYGKVIINELSKDKIDIEFNLGDYTGNIKSIDKNSFVIDITYNYGSIKTTLHISLVMKDEKYNINFDENLVNGNDYVFNNAKNIFINELDDLGLYRIINEYNKNGFIMLK